MAAAFLRTQAGQGRTVLVSSHVLSEVEQTVDDVRHHRPGAPRARPAPRPATADHRHVVVRTPDPSSSATPSAAHAPPRRSRREDGALHVVDSHAAVIGRIAFEAQVELHELRPAASDLEQVFLSLTGGATS